MREQDISCPSRPATNCPAQYSPPSPPTPNCPAQYSPPSPPTRNCPAQYSPPSPPTPNCPAQSSPPTVDCPTAPTPFAPNCPCPPDTASLPLPLSEFSVSSLAIKCHFGLGTDSDGPPNGPCDPPSVAPHHPKLICLSVSRSDFFCPVQSGVAVICPPNTLKTPKSPNYCPINRAPNSQTPSTCPSAPTPHPTIPPTNQDLPFPSGLPRSPSDSPDIYVPTSTHNSPLPHPRDSSFAPSPPTLLPFTSHASPHGLSAAASCPWAAVPGGTPGYFTFPEGQEEPPSVWMAQDGRLGERFLDSLSHLEDWIQRIRVTPALPDPTPIPHRDAKQALRAYEVLLGEMRDRLLDLETLNRQYWSLTQSPQQRGLLGLLRSRMQDLNQFWDHLYWEADTKYRALKLRVQQREEFDVDRESVQLWLSEMDQGLSSVEYISQGNPSDKILQLQAFLEDVRRNMQRMEQLFARSDLLMQQSHPRDAQVLEEEMTELGRFCHEIFSHLSRLQKRLVSTRLVLEDAFLGGEFEKMSSGSSDVFLEMGSDDEECPEVALSAPGVNPCIDGAPLGTLPVDLEWDPLGDVGRSSSNDGEESFCTATSVPRKRLQTGGSQSSLNSLPWATVCNADSRVGTESPKGFQDPLVPPFGPHNPDGDCETTGSTLTPTQVLSDSLQEATAGSDPSSCLAVASQGVLDAPRGICRQPVTLGRSELPVVTLEEADVISGTLKPNPTQRRRHGKKKLVKQTENTRESPEVSILVDCSRQDPVPCGPDKASRGAPRSLVTWIKRLASLSVLLLLLGLSLFIFPTNRPKCPSQGLAWSLMLSYVNGPPPT